MQKTELAKICGISRAHVYNLLKYMTEDEILEKYNQVKSKNISNKSPEMRRYKEDIEKYKKQIKILRTTLNEKNNESIEYISQNNKAKHCIKQINYIVKNIVLNCQKTNMFDVEFKYINDIYEITKNWE